MANPTCTIKSLMSNNPCFNLETIDTHRRLILEVWFMAVELKAIGGTDYTSALATSLQAAQTALFFEASLDQMDTAQTAILYNNALAAGGNPGANINAILKNVSPLNNANDIDLRGMWLVLLCQLGVHKAYPQ